MAAEHSIDIGLLLAQSGRSLELDRRVALGAFEDFEFPAGGRVVAELESLAGHVLAVRGSIALTAVRSCGRCLEPVERAMSVAVDERMDLEPRGNDPVGESNVIHGDRLDLEDLTAQLVYAALPLTVVCRDDCLGLCPTCGENKNLGTCACAEQ